MYSCLLQHPVALVSIYACAQACKYVCVCLCVLHMTGRKKSLIGPGALVSTLSSAGPRRLWPATPLSHTTTHWCFMRAAPTYKTAGEGLGGVRCKLWTAGCGKGTGTITHLLVVKYVSPDGEGMMRWEWELHRIYSITDTSLTRSASSS